MAHPSALTKFSSPAMIRKWVAFHEAAEKYTVRTSEQNPSGTKIGIDKAALYHAHVSAYYDIARYKAMHLEDPMNQLSDSIKRSAYFTKWILKLRPFWINRASYKPNKSDRGIFLNEEFAIEWAHANLSFELGRQIPPLSFKKHCEFLYDLHFRQLNEDALIHIFQDLYDLANNEPALVLAQQPA